MNYEECGWALGPGGCRFAKLFKLDAMCGSVRACEMVTITYSVGRLIVGMFCNMFSDDTFRLHGSCSAADWPIELSEDLLQNL